MHQRLSYRPHIDGLRAIAVMGVVLTHFDLPYLPGGFVGVDVFFVISGFLISKSVYSEVATGEFSLRAFYERRARRILPAFVAVSAVTAALAYLLFLPIDLVPFAKSLAAAALFVANIYFYATSDYFAPGALQLPLLHYWSLGVEEQFYVFFPLAVMAASRLSRRAVGLAVAGLFVASLLAAEAMLQIDPPAVFYLLPFRAFELLLGAGLALPAIRFPVHPLLSGASVAAGIVAIVWSMAAIGPETAFPGLMALVPCLGATLVIWGGEGIATWPSKALGSLPFSLVGKMSYSLYLVHWPVAAFASAMGLDSASVAYLLGGVAVSLVLAWLSYRFVETPFRQRLVVGSRRSLLTASVSASLGLLAGSALAIGIDGFPGRMSREVNRVLQYAFYDRKPFYRDGICFLRRDQAPEQFDREACIPAERPNVILWGDSTAAQIFWGLNEALAKQGFHVGQISASACGPAVGVDIPYAPHCLPFNDMAFNTILEVGPDVVVLGATSPNPEELQSVDRTVAALRALEIEVIVLGTFPAFVERVPVILARRMMAGNDDVFSDREMQPQIPRYDARLAEHFGPKQDAQYVPILDFVCPGGRCLFMKDDAPLYWDRRHFTREGSVYYGAMLVEKMQATLARVSRAIR